MRHPRSTWTERHRVATLELCVLALLAFGSLVGRVVGMLGVRAAGMFLG